MAHGYRILQRWNQWLTQQFLGSYLLETEKASLAELLKTYYGKHALLLGVPHQYNLLTATTLTQHTLITPLPTKHNNHSIIEGYFHELPILTGSVDIVILPHTLELVDNPRQLLAEACRVIKPEGIIAICGFNPYSAWGIKKILSQQNEMPWTSNFIQASKVKNWLKMADFELEHHTSILYTPPVDHPIFYRRMRLLEILGACCFSSFGGVYVLLARAKVIPLTPIRLKWKQRLSNIQIAPTMPGHIARSISSEEIS